MEFQADELRGGADPHSMDQLIDLSNIQNISDLNQLTTIDKRATGGNAEQDEGVDVGQIEVDLDEDEFEEMERIVRNKMNFAQQQVH